MNYQNIIFSITIVSLISGILGLLIAIFSKFFSAPKEEKVDVVTKLLPGYNCGGCGRAGCKNFASAIVNDNEDINKCKPLKKEKKEEIINYLKKI